MKGAAADAGSLELLSASQRELSGERGVDDDPEASSQHRDGSFTKTGDEYAAQPGWKRWLPVAEVNEGIAFSLLAISIVPIILLAIFAPRLALRLSRSACLPNGEFIIPGTASIWDPKYIFTISIAFGDHSYSYVKIIDAIWDVLVGRGGQLLLIWIAYRTFHKSLMYIMQTHPVPYPVYGAVAFDPGSLRSITQFIYNLDLKESRHSRRAARIYVIMAICTIYIAAMPTLFSAMTGYAAISTPSIEVVNGWERKGASPDYCANFGSCTILTCDGGLKPVWAVVWDSSRYADNQPRWITEEYAVGEDGDIEYNYYKAHEDAYMAAANKPACSRYFNGSTLNNCVPLQKPSTIHDPYGYDVIPLDAPLLDIDVLGKNSQGAPKAFTCGVAFTNIAFFTEHINEGGEQGISALCTAGSRYQWGFSFLLLLIVSILNLVFAVLMYGLWVDVRRKGDLRTREEAITASGSLASSGGHGVRKLNNPSNLRSALDIARQAELQYGQDVHDWPSWKLESIVWRGNKGIQLQGVS